MAAGRAERSGRVPRSLSRDVRDAAAFSKTVLSWPRSDEQFWTSVTAWVIALRLVPLRASSAARALAACCSGDSEGDGVGAGLADAGTLVGDAGPALVLCWAGPALCD